MIRKLVTAFAALLALTIAATLAAQADSAATTTICGSVIQSIVRTGVPDLETMSDAFIQLPGAAVAVKVPPGRQECLKVLVTMSASCNDPDPAPKSDFCMVRVLDNGKQFLPVLPGADLVFQSASNFPAAQAMEFVRRVGPGRHIISVQVSTSSSIVDFEINAWTMDVTVTN